jgi:hypothetical protein
MSKFGLIISSVVLLLSVVSCRYHKEIEFIDDPLMTYQYYLSQHGILKHVHGHNQLFLYGCNLQNIDMIDNFVGTMYYDVTNWSNDTIEVCLNFEKSEWSWYKERYHQLSSTKTTIGKFVIKFNYRLLNPGGSSGLSHPDIIDSVQTNSNCTWVNLYYQGKFIDSVEINKLYFSDNSIFYSLTSGDNNHVREIILKGRLKKIDILKQIFAKYKEIYCK